MRFLTYRWTLTSIFYLLILNPVWACGDWHNVNDCHNPEEALKAIRLNNPNQMPAEQILAKTEEERLALFDYDPSTIKIVDKVFVEHNRNDWIHWTFVLKGQNPMFEADQPIGPYNKKLISVKVHYFQSIRFKAKTRRERQQAIVYKGRRYVGKRPLVIGFPTVLTYDQAEPIFASQMAKKGISVMIPEAESIVSLSLPLLEVDKVMRRNIIKARMLIDAAEKFFAPEINTQKIGTWGLSLGGVRAATLIGVDPRIKAAALISAGGNNADIFTYSIQDFVKAYRNQKMHELNINETQEYFDVIRQHSHVDPLYFAHRVSAEKIFMIIARNDRKIPTRNQLELWDAFSDRDAQGNVLSRPLPTADKTWFSGKHKRAIYAYLSPYILRPFFFHLKNRLVDFYDKRFGGIR